MERLNIWNKHPIALNGEKVKLLPLERMHFNKLIEIAGNPKIWEFVSINGADPNIMRKHLSEAVIRRATREQYPFTVFEKSSGRIIGSTMFHTINQEHRKLEIGWTFMDPNYWKKGYNRDCKLVMLTYCFETLRTVRVQFMCNENNERSKKALSGIGATLEGVLRNERIRANEEVQNTCVCSIIASEWDEVKEKLAASLRR